MKAFFENQSKYDAIPFMVDKFDNLNFLPHWHVEVELVLVLEGAIQMSINTERRKLHSGDIAICFSNAIHSYATESSSVLLVKFLPEFVDSVGMWQKNNHLIVPFVQHGRARGQDGLPPDIREQMRSLLLGLYRENKQQHSYYAWVVRGKLLELCAICLRHLPRREASELRQDEEHGWSGIQLIRAALQYIDENFTHPITLDDIAGRMNVSPFYFSRMFNKIVGMNLKSYQNVLRLNKAKRMIVDEPISITEIAYECGFNSVRTFNRWFRLLHGQSPSELRKTGLP